MVKINSFVYVTAVCCLLFVFSCKQEPSLITATSTQTPIVVNPVATSLNGKNKIVYTDKVSAKKLVKIACEGTSLTYGQNEPGPVSPINGASQHRAVYQYPETLKLFLTSYGFKANVVNRGYPGDRTTEGLLRWKDSTTADVVIIEYSTNDAFNFGGYPSGSVDVSTFTDNLTQIVQRRLNQGAWVIITSPPGINTTNTNYATILNTYKVAIATVASKFDLPVIDVQKSVVKGAESYYDAVHLSGDSNFIWASVAAQLVQK